MAADMRYFAASDQAAYEYPGADQGPLRDAFCRGAASVASPPPTAMRDALVTARSYLDSMLKYGDEYIIPPENLKAAISQIDAALSDASVTEGWGTMESAPYDRPFAWTYWNDVEWSFPRRGEYIDGKFVRDDGAELAPRYFHRLRWSECVPLPASPTKGVA